MMVGQYKMGAAVTLALGIGMLAPAALARTATPAQQQAPGQAKTTANRPDTGPTPTDAELKQFAHAAQDVQKIRQTAQPQIAKAKSANARTELQKTAEKKMEAAVRSHHLSVHRYEQIAMVAQTNRAIRAKLIKLMQKPSNS
jgi:uncharacterized membrane protein YhiD involved in acid resistance